MVFIPAKGGDKYPPEHSLFLPEREANLPEMTNVYRKADKKKKEY